MKKFFCLMVLMFVFVAAPIASADHGRSDRRRGSGRVQRGTQRSRSSGYRHRGVYRAPICRPVYDRPVYYRSAPRYRYSRYSERYSGYRVRYYRPRPVVYVAPAPVIYPAPIYVQPPPVIMPVPVVVERPVVQMLPPPAPITQAAEPTEVWQQVVYKSRVYQYQEVGRRLHQHGDNKGLLDWIQGQTQDGHLIKIKFADNGSVREVDD